MTYEQAAKRIRAAASPHHLFGTDEAKAKSTYRRLSMAVHPDKVDASGRRAAQELFDLLGSMWAEYNGTGATSHFTMATRRRSYAVSRDVTALAIANVYPCTWMEDDEEKVGWMKIPRLPKDADLMQAEAEALKAINASTDKAKVFIPDLIETFRHRDKATKVERRINVTERIDTMYSLAEVMRAFPGGLDHRDAAWMFRRLLFGLGVAHDCGYVNGAVLPQNIWIHPEHHGVLIGEWCFSVTTKQPMRAWDARSWKFYPAEVEAKEQVTEATDLFMAAKVLEVLVGDRAEGPLRSFIRGCTLEKESMRPHNAWDLCTEYTGVIERLFGPRRFRKFRMPTGT